MKTTEKTRFGIGTKLIIGLGVLIGISTAVGLGAIWSLLSIQGNSENLSQKYLPETELTNEIERETLWTMYNVRGYWLSMEETYLKDATTHLQALDAALVKAEALSAKYPELTVLRAKAPVARAALQEYTGLLTKTQATTEVVLKNRAVSSEAVQVLLGEVTEYLANQKSSFAAETRSGAKAAKLNERLGKILEIQSITNMIHELRVAYFKSQSYRDSSFVTKALADVQGVNGRLDALLRITTQDVNRRQLEVIRTNLGIYVTSVQTWIDSTAILDGLAGQRLTSATTLSSTAEEVSLAALKASLELGRGNSVIVGASSWTIILGLIISMSLGVLVAFILIRSITGPLNLVTALSRKVTKGDFAIERQTVKSQDELGLLTESFYDMVEGLKAKASLIESIANGILVNKIPLASEEDGLGRSMVRMQESLNEILTQVNVAVDQMASGSDQVSTAAQSLSQGATEQASSLEEISASANEIHSQSKQNAENAMTANQLAKQASQSAQQGNQQMKDLMALLEKMTKSSEETKTIVKTIDDIAFQVNLLALNANVEAARAGKYGKGFAVVAEEVRNLAVRSATAVNETTRMVEESIRNIQDVNATASKTGDQLNGILGNANKVADFLEEIAASSQEQARAMGQINGGLDQIDQVTQSNTASAEESASASEELSGQAQQLKVMVSRFQLSDDAMQRAQSRVVVGDHRKNVRSQTPGPTPASAPSLLKRGQSVRPSAPANDIILNDDFDTF